MATVNNPNDAIIVWALGKLYFPFIFLFQITNFLFLSAYEQEVTTGADTGQSMPTHAHPNTLPIKPGYKAINQG